MTIHRQTQPLSLIPARTDIFKVDCGKQRTLHDIDDDVLLFRVAYVPYVIGALAWDWVDSILDQAAQMKIEETKALSRGIREVKRKYAQFREHRIFDTMVKQEQMHSEQFQEGYADYFDELYKGFKEQVAYRYPRLDKQWVYFHATTYTAMVILRALFRYAAWCDRTIESILGAAQNSILPQHFGALYQLIEMYLGDDNEAVRKEDLNVVVDELYNKIMSIEFTGELVKV